MDSKSRVGRIELFLGCTRYFTGKGKNRCVHEKGDVPGKTNGACRSFKDRSLFIRSFGYSCGGTYGVEGGRRRDDKRGTVSVRPPFLPQTVSLLLDVTDTREQGRRSGG